MIEDGGQHGIKVSDGMQQSLGLTWNSKMTISVKTGPIQKHLRRKKLVVKLVDLLLLCDYCTILNVQYLIFLLNYCILYTSSYRVEREMVALKDHLLWV